MRNDIVKLLPHNEMLYNDICKHIDVGEKSIFYSEATGLGKSYIFMRLVQDYFVGKRILYIVPRIAIWDNLTHYREFSQLEATIDMKTFAAFNNYFTDDKLYEMYDVVFVDECHHMLSDVQGINVAIFLEDMVNNDKITFGMTATPKHNGVFVDDMYFKVSCYGYDVFEAISKGILPKIDVAIADIDFNSIPDDLRKKYSITGTKSILEQIIEERSDITHWLTYFGRVEDLIESESEISKLFPDFKILKLYRGTGDKASEIIDEFENYEGKVMLMSVSMLLEGMHLSNVEGILLYRNVGRTNTYFQIYGRLCKLGASHSPLLLDVTNSILNLSDVNRFKSPKHRKTGVKYSRRDLFDVTSKTYRYIELRDEMNPFIVKEYRGVRWTTLGSLDRALGKPHGVASGYINHKLGRTAESYIDYVLRGSTYEEYINNMFRGINRITILGKEYKYTSFPDLSKQIGRDGEAGYLREHNIDSYVKLIEWEHDHGFVIGGEYKNVNITSILTVSKYMNINRMTIRTFIDTEDISVQECIDMYQDNMCYKGIHLVNGLRELSVKIGKPIRTLYHMYRKVRSIKSVIDYFIPEERVYRGIVIKDNSTISDIARQLDVNPCNIMSYMSKPSRTIEDAIDYYLDGKVLKKSGKKVPVKRHDSYLPDEFNMIDEMYKLKKSWKDITCAVNKLECNVSRGTTRSENSTRTYYQKRLKSEREDYKPNVVYNKLSDEELEIMKIMRDEGRKWKEIASELNKLKCNVDNGIVRDDIHLAAAYTDRMRRKGHL